MKLIRKFTLKGIRGARGRGLAKWATYVEEQVNGQVVVFGTLRVFVVEGALSVPTRIVVTVEPREEE